MLRILIFIAALSHVITLNAQSQKDSTVWTAPLDEITSVMPIPKCRKSCSMAQCQYKRMKVRLVNAPIREFPMDSAKVIYFATDSINSEEYHMDNGVIYGRLISEEHENGFYHVSVDTGEGFVNGWACGCFMEGKPIPYYLSRRSDTTYYQLLVEDMQWKEYCDTVHYSKKQMAELYQHLGLAYLEADRPFQAIQWLTKANKIVRKDYIIAKIGISKRLLGDYRGSNRDLEKIKMSSSGFCDGLICTSCIGGISMALDLPNYWLLVVRAKNYMALNMNEKALVDLNTSIAIRPNDNGEAYYHRGGIKYNSGNKTGGCSDFSIAGEQGIEEAYQTIREYCNE